MKRFSDHFNPFRAAGLVNTTLLYDPSMMGVIDLHPYLGRLYLRGLTEPCHFTISRGWGTRVKEAPSPFILAIVDTGTARALTWSMDFRPIGVTLPTTTTPSKWTYIFFVGNGSEDVYDVIDVKVEV